MRARTLLILFSCVTINTFSHDSAFVVKFFLFVLFSIQVFYLNRDEIFLLRACTDINCCTINGSDEALDYAVDIIYIISRS
jgi:hypothetical protein